MKLAAAVQRDQRNRKWHCILSLSALKWPTAVLALEQRGERQKQQAARFKEQAGVGSDDHSFRSEVQSTFAERASGHDRRTFRQPHVSDGYA